MNLRKWCEETGWNLTDVMRESGVSYSSVLKGAEGQLSDYPTARAIEKVTESRVTVYDLCEGSVGGG